MSENINICERSYLLKHIEVFGTLSQDHKKTFFSNASSFCCTHSFSVRGGLDGEDELWEKLRCFALECLDDESPEIRRTAGLLLGDLSRAFKADVYIKSKHHILSRIECLVKQIENNKQLITNEVGRNFSDMCNPDDVIKSVSPHKLLDSWICCLENIIKGNGVELCRESELLNHILYCLDCKDMYLEQDCLKLVHVLLHDYTMYSSLAESSNIQMTDQDYVKDFNEIENILSSILLKGIFSLNPGARYQSCKTIAEMFSSIPEGRLVCANFQLVGTLLPAIWFNRYSKENGLQQLCQDTWVGITKGQGKLLIEAHFQVAMEYCLEKLDGKSADCLNSCYCLSEVVRKLDRNLVDPMINKIYIHLRPVLSDDKMDWQIVDASCLLLTEMISNYASQMDFCLNELIELMSEKVRCHPSTNIMDSSSLVLSSLVKHYGAERSNLEQMMDDIGKYFIDFIPTAERFSTAQPLTSPYFESVGPVSIERNVTPPGSDHDTKPMKIQQKTDGCLNQIYGQICLILHLLSSLPQEHPQKLIDLTKEIWVILETSEKLKLYDLAALILSRVPEVMVALPKQNCRQQLDLFLETLVKMAKQSHHLQLREMAFSVIHKCVTTFDRDLIRSKLVSIDMDFAEKLNEFFA